MLKTAQQNICLVLKVHLAAHLVVGEQFVELTNDVAVVGVVAVFVQVDAVGVFAIDVSAAKDFEHLFKMRACFALEFLHLHYHHIYRKALNKYVGQTFFYDSPVLRDASPVDVEDRLVNIFQVVPEDIYADYVQRMRPLLHRLLPVVAHERTEVTGKACYLVWLVGFLQLDVNNLPNRLAVYHLAYRCNEVEAEEAHLVAAEVGVLVAVVAELFDGAIEQCAKNDLGGAAVRHQLLENNVVYGIGYLHGLTISIVAIIVIKLTIIAIENSSVFFISKSSSPSSSPFLWLLRWRCRQRVVLSSSVSLRFCQQAMSQLRYG